MIYVLLLYNFVEIPYKSLIIVVLPLKNKNSRYFRISYMNANGRNDGIWTHDPFHPKEVRYHAALRPERLSIGLTIIVEYRGVFNNYPSEFSWVNRLLPEG